MLTGANVNSVSEETDWPTFFIIPFDACGQVKVLPDGSIYLITNENPQSEDQTNEAILSSFESNIANQPETPKLVKIQPQINELEELPVPVAQNDAIDAPYSCSACQATFSTPKEHSDHLKCHKKFKCTNCPATYNIETNLKIHFELVHRTENTLRNCPICGVALRFKRAASLKSHMMIHQVEEVYTCEQCEAEFEKENEYSQHVISHNSKKPEQEPPLSCPQCILQFETKEELKLHKANHTKAWKYFKRKRTKQKGPARNVKYTCDICNKGFIKKSLLERHERIHSGEKPFECNLCQQTFSQKVTLENHLLKHTGRKPFACFLCPARFNQKGNLRVHINKTHTAPQNGQKVFKCSQCSCMFKRIASLNGHVTKAHLTIESTEDGVVNDVLNNLKDLKDLKNTNFETSVTLTESGSEKKYSVKLKKIGDTKWYKCTYCFKLCKKPSDIIRHIRIHTKERPYECKLCPATFTSKAAVHNHKKLHFSKIFKCDVCDSVLDSNMEYIDHLHKGECGKLLLPNLPDQVDSVISKVPKQTGTADS
uniref:Gastrula zinc finger protein XlCGF57.1-like n=1 Tax=Diabrotica virgifera virgifera TaxID=50390 RepID=A0A6P7H2P3_DIAVI